MGVWRVLHHEREITAWMDEDVRIEPATGMTRCHYRPSQE